MAQTELQRPSEVHGKVIYTAITRTTGGRKNSVSRRSAGRLDIELSPRGSSRLSTNPEQLLVAGWSACFECAIALVAHQKKITLSADMVIDAEVDLCLDNGEYFLGARLNVSIPGVEPTIAQGLSDVANRVGPYSKATSADIAVAYNVV